MHIKFETDIREGWIKTKLDWMSLSGTYRIPVLKRRVLWETTLLKIQSQWKLTLQSGVSLIGLVLWNQVTVGLGKPVTLHSNLNFWPARAITLLSGIVNLGFSDTSTAVRKSIQGNKRNTLTTDNFNKKYYKDKTIHNYLLLLWKKQCHAT